MRAVIFGASGLLGRSVLHTFAGTSVTGTGFSRSSNGLVRVDATSAGDIERLLDRDRPSVVVNCVGERRPVAWASTPDQARGRNVVTARLIAEGARRYGARLLHISSDYVFDGQAAPYRPNDRPKPLNVYGRWKLLAEQAVLAACPDAAVLRLPMLYGPVQFAAETNLTDIARQVSLGARLELDDVCVRYPTHADEAAEVCRRLAEALLHGQCTASVIHWSASQGFTKYRLALMVARRFGLSDEHIRAGKADATRGDRPLDCRLVCQGLPAAFDSIRRRPFRTEFPPVVEPWLLFPRPVAS
ncbi:dTDP-4-dehydrorhamnose reductase family protein [Streptomyces buecherae]|uniref:dTDP-4-dehydrorhamnose reductase family protein n=1 Tax=Streptomyces buecherae TaxID=2763006 RepID=UPI0037B614A8